MEYPSHYNDGLVLTPLLNENLEAKCVNCKLGRCHFLIRCECRELTCCSCFYYDESCTNCLSNLRNRDLTIMRTSNYFSDLKHHKCELDQGASKFARFNPEKINNRAWEGEKRLCKRYFQMMDFSLSPDSAKICTEELLNAATSHLETIETLFIDNRPTSQFYANLAVTAGQMIPTVTSNPRVEDFLRFCRKKRALKRKQIFAKFVQKLVSVYLPIVGVMIFLSLIPTTGASFKVTKGFQHLDSPHEEVQEGYTDKIYPLINKLTCSNVTEYNSTFAKIHDYVLRTNRCRKIKLSFKQRTEKRQNNTKEALEDDIQALKTHVHNLMALTYIGHMQSFYCIHRLCIDSNPDNMTVTTYASSDGPNNQAFMLFSVLILLLFSLNFLACRTYSLNLSI